MVDRRGDLYFPVTAASESSQLTPLQESPASQRSPVTAPSTIGVDLYALAFGRLSVLPNGTAPLPLTIPQSTEISCAKAAEKLRKDSQGQNSTATVITSCIDQGSA